MKYLVNPKIMWSIIGLMFFLFLFVFEHDYFYIPGSFSKIIFYFSALYWVAMLSLAFFVNRQPQRSAMKTERVISSGIYSRVRHPIYSGDIVLFFGLFFIFPSLWIWMSLLFGILIFVLFANFEEDVLKERFGRSFSSYKTKTPKFLPRLLKKKRKKRIETSKI